MIVAIYSHEYDEDVRVFRTYDGARAWRDAIAAEWWEHEIPDDYPRPAKASDLGEAYFDWHSEHDGKEYFTTHDCELTDE